MEWVETTGRTVAEALEAALDQLGVDEHDAEVVIVEEPKTALFGLRKSEARVRARVRPTSPRPKRQQRDRRGRSRDGAGRASSERAGGRSSAGGSSDGGSGDEEREPANVGARSGEGEADGDAAGGPGAGSRSRRRRRRGGRSGAGGTEADADAAAGEGDADGDEGAPPRGGRTDGSSRAGGGGRSGAGRARQRSSGRRSASETSGDPEEEEMPIEQQAELAERFVRGVVECFGLTDATTSVRVDEALVEVAVTGEGLGLLIGPHGSTLSALQELTRTVVQRRGTEHGTRIVVDVAGYRAKRAAALVEFTKSVAAEVLASGRPHALEPMSASDRKIVHDTVNEIDGVSTSSEGEEERRHVVIHAAAAATGGAPATAAEATAAEAPAGGAPAGGAPVSEGEAFGATERPGGPDDGEPDDAEDEGELAAAAEETDLD